MLNISQNKHIMTDIVSIYQVTKSYPLGKSTVHALNGINLSIKKGDFAAIAGPSGSGKTTLLNLIGCVDVPTSGSVKIDGKSIETLNDRDRTDLRLQHLGFIFQTFNLIQVLTVFQNVEFPLMLQGNLSTDERQQRVHEMVDKVGLTNQLFQRPNELSGGQRQRVAIARALVTRPQIILADEPTANLDSVTGENIIDLMRDMNESEHTTFIFSTHDPKVMSHAKRLIQLEDGLITKDNG
jgi:putative ABC transport system ATP-binding protein